MRVAGSEPGGTVTAMPAERSAPPERAGTGTAGREPVLQRRTFRPWAYAGWVLIGALWAFCFSSAQSFGLFVMPLALIGTVWLCLGYTRPEGWPGLFGGLGLIAAYLAFLHRHGPGRYCSVPSDPSTCSDLLNPWIYVTAAGVLLLACALVTWRWYTKLITPRYRR
jgi:hypothetical protein